MQLPRFAYRTMRPFMRVEQARCKALAYRSAAEESFGAIQQFSTYGLTFLSVTHKRLVQFQTEYDGLIKATQPIEVAYCQFRDGAAQNPSDDLRSYLYPFLAAKYKYYSKALAAQQTLLKDLLTAYLPTLFDVLVRHDQSSRRLLNIQLASGWKQPEAAELLASTKTEVYALKKELKGVGPTYEHLPKIERLFCNTLRMRSLAIDLKIRRHDLTRTAEALTNYNDPRALVCAANEALAELKKKFDYSYYAGTQKPLSDAIKVVEQLSPTLAAFKLAVKRHEFKSAEELMPHLKPLYPALRTCSDIVKRHAQATKDVSELTRKVRSVSRRLSSILKKWHKTDTQGLDDAAHLASLLLRLLQSPFEKFPPLEAIRDQIAILNTIKDVAENADGKDCSLPALQVVEGLSVLPAFAGFVENPE